MRRNASRCGCFPNQDPSRSSPSRTQFPPVKRHENVVVANHESPRLREDQREFHVDATEV